MNNARLRLHIFEKMDDKLEYFFKDAIIYSALSTQGNSFLKRLGPLKI